MNFLRKNETIIYILLAFIFSLSIHLIWIYIYGDNPNYYWNNQLMIDTNDGYYFASAVEKELYGLHQDNPLIPSMYSQGLVFVTYLLAKILPFSLDTIIFYMPAVFSSLVVIPIILIGSLYNNRFWGFLSSLLGSIAWSYYNRTLVGYYDTDIFALTFPVFILYFLLKSLKSYDIKDVLYASIFIAIYNFLYLPGSTVSSALGLMYMVYILYIYYFEKKDTQLFKFIILIFIALSQFYMPIFPQTILKVVILIGLYFIFKRKEFSTKALFISLAVVFAYFLVSTEVLLTMYYKVVRYTSTGTEEGLHFYTVMQTISEANGIPMFPDGSGRSNVAHRVIGSTLGFLIFLAGYVLLVFKHKEFLIALPLVGIGLFAHWGGLRFTVYAVPIAALSAIYLLFFISEYLKDKYAKIALLVLGTTALIYPNIVHTTQYNAGTVMSKPEVEDLTKLKKLAKPKDYTLSWWDYGYPIWYYSDTISLIDGGKHNEDNYIISKIFLSDSPLFAANFAKLAVYQHSKISELNREKNLDLSKVPDEFKLKDKDGKEYLPSPRTPAIKSLLKVGQKEQKDVNEFLYNLESSKLKLPKLDRDVYLYAPLKMNGIFITVSQFGNIDLQTGNRLRDLWFYPTHAISQKGSLLAFDNGFIFDYKKGVLIYKNSKFKVKYFITTEILSNGDIKISPNKYGDGDKVVLFIKNLRRFIVMDSKTFQSNYVQMFLLGNYNKELFELVVKSPYSRVYKVK